jgi:hypothetical protein
MPDQELGLTGRDSDGSQEREARQRLSDDLGYLLARQWLDEANRAAASAELRNQQHASRPDR